MAVLLIKIEDTATLLMNEFYDYDGVCYGLTRSRQSNENVCIDLADFYEGTIQSQKISGIPVLFVLSEEGKYHVIGWYKEAEVYREVLRPSLFLEGNVKADARNVYLLPEQEQFVIEECRFTDKLYEVVEADDSRYEQLMDKVQNYRGQNVFIRLGHVNNFINAKIKYNYDACMEQCTRIAGRLMADQCIDVREIGLLEAYAEQACILDGQSVDGYYYQAMACHQLGKVKKAIKAIEKALKLEPDASDLMAMKGHILISMGYVETAADLFHQAWQMEGDDAYLMLEGRAWLFKGQMDRALQAFKQIENRQLLDDEGINLKDMEKRWPFMNVRGFHLKDFFHKE